MWKTCLWAELQPWCLCLQWKTCPWAEHSFSKLSHTSPTSQLIFQLFRRFICVTTHSPTLPLLHLRHSSFSNPSFAFPTSQALHLIHLANSPWSVLTKGRSFTENAGTKVAVLSKGRRSTANSGSKVTVLLGLNRCGSLPLLSAPHSLFSIWTNIKRSKRSQGHQRGGEESGFG